jgi:hypothetical protein
MPELKQCPRCRLGLEAGMNRDGLAWHECRDGVELQAAQLLASKGLIEPPVAVDILSRLMIHRALVDVSPVQQLAAGIKALTDAAKRQQTSGGPSEAMKQFLKGPRDLVKGGVQK